jgi:hypothetical protein
MILKVFCEAVKVRKITKIYKGDTNYRMPLLNNCS